MDEPVVGLGATWLAAMLSLVVIRRSLTAVAFSGTGVAIVWAGLFPGSGLLTLAPVIGVPILTLSLALLLHQRSRIPNGHD